MTRETLLQGPLGLRVGLTSTSPYQWGEGEELHLGAHLPGTWHPSDGPAQVQVSHEESTGAAAFEQDGDRVRWRSHWGGTVPVDWYFLTHAMARDAWLGEGYATAHAACVRRERVTLLAGPSGSGKSTLAHVLSRDGELLSGNTTLLAPSGGELHVHAGTRTSTHLAPDAERLGISGRRVGDRVLTRSLEVPELPLQVERVVLPQLRGGPARLEHIGASEALHTLVPLVLGAVRADAVVEGGTYVGRAHPEAKRAIVSGLQEALKHVAVVRAHGDAETVAELLETT